MYLWQSHRQNREGTAGSASVRRTGPRMDGTVNTCERSVNAVRYNKPKTLKGLGQNGDVAGNEGLVLPHRGQIGHRRIERT
jgi:hypothetical protein